MKGPAIGSHWVVASANRWRYIGYGVIGHIWHDSLNNRYVISDKFGPVNNPSGDGKTQRGKIINDFA